MIWVLPIAAVVICAALRLVRRRREGDLRPNEMWRTIGFALLLCTAMIATNTLTLPIGSISRKSDGAIVLLGWSDSNAVMAARRQLETMGVSATEIHAPEQVKAVISASWPSARFVPIRQAQYPYGCTLEYFADWMRTQDPTSVAPTVLLVAPRARNCSAALADIAQLSHMAPSRFQNVTVLSCDRELPTAPSVFVAMPSVVSRDTKDVPFSFQVDASGAASDVQIELTAYDAPKSTMAALKDDGNGFLRLDHSTAAASLTIPGGHQQLQKGVLPAPPTGTSAIFVQVSSKYGEPLCAAASWVSTVRPQLAVMVKKGADPFGEQLYEFITALNLDVARVELDLGGAASVDINAQLLGTHPLLLIASELSNDEAGVLWSSIAKRQSMPGGEGTATSVVFVGSGRSASDTKGWLHGPLAPFAELVKDGVLRQIAIAWDTSGSMSRSISPTISTSRRDYIKSVIDRISSAINQRNTGVIVGLGERGTSCSNLTLTTIGIGDVSYQPGFVETTDVVRHFLNESHSPRSQYSDLVIFCDPDDLHNGCRFVDEIPNDEVSNIAKLRERGCAVHLVSVAGAIGAKSASKAVDGTTTLASLCRLRMGEFSDANALDAQIEALLFNSVFRRVRVLKEQGLETQSQLTPEQRSALIHACEADLSLIDAVGGPQFIAAVPETTRSSVYLWATVDGGVTGTPLLSRKLIPLPNGSNLEVLWLSATLNAEEARSLGAADDATSARSRDALARLILATVEAGSSRIKASPIRFQSTDGGARIRARRDDFGPFQVLNQSCKTGGAVVGTFDPRDLSRPSWLLEDVTTPGGLEVIDFTIEDRDPRIGSVSTQVVRRGLLPSLLVGANVNDLRDTLAAGSGGATTTYSQHGGIPLWLFLVIIVAWCALIAGLLYLC